MKKVPMSLLLQHLLMFYKYGGKQLYYNNTHDGQREIDINQMNAETTQPTFIESTETFDEDDCDSCKI